MLIGEVARVRTIVAALQPGSDPRLWYVTRAAGICAYILLALGTAFGLFQSLARALGVRAGWALVELHQFIALIAAAFVALHLVTLALDPFLPFSLSNLVLPVGEPYKPLAVALGVLGLYALAVVLISSWLRGRISYAVWRGLHVTSFVVFGMVTAHGLLAGTDTHQPWMRGVYFAAIAVVIFLTGMRLILWLIITPDVQSSPTRSGR
jgi:predicted ferric reductase